MRPLATYSITYKHNSHSKIRKITFFDSSLRISSHSVVEKVLWHAVALHDFISETPGDLQFKMGAEIAITEVVSDDWLKGELDGKKGIFPSTFVEKRTEESNIKLSSSKSANVTDKEQGTKSD